MALNGTRGEQHCRGGQPAGISDYPLLSGLILMSAESEELSNRENMSSRDRTVSCDLKFVIF